jgi:peptidyl-prolyl cis-trans isomerase D
MLQALREKMTGWMALLVIGLLIIPFAFFGIDQYFTGLRDTWVAKVEDREITPDALRRRIEESRQSLRRFLGEAYDPRLFETPEWRRKVLEQMIQEEAIALMAERIGVVIPAERLRREILGIEVLHSDGRFDPDRYQRLLRAQGLTAQGFEERLRRELLLRDWPQQVAVSALVTDAEVDRFLALQGQERDIAFLELPAPEAPAEPSEDELRAWYEQHLDRFREPEKVVIEYVELREADLAPEVNVDETELRRRYEEQRHRFIRPEQRRVAHILIAPEGVDAEAEKAALAKAEALRRQLDGGADFAVLAREHSADPGSKAAGGDLGWIERGMTDPAFEEAVFAAAAGQLVGPLRSASGYHLIRVLEVRPEEGRGFEEVREELLAELTAGERERRYLELSGRLHDLVYRDPTSLAPVAEALGAEIKSEGPFDRNGDAGIAAHPEVIAQAFSDLVLVDGQTSEPIELERGHTVVLRVREHQPARVRPFEDVRAEALEGYRADWRERQGRERAEAWLARLSEGSATLDSIGEESGASPRRETAVRRHAAALDPGLVAEAFRLPVPGSAPSRAVVALGAGRFALLEVSAVRDADPQSASADERRAARERLRADREMRERQAFLDALRAQLEVQIAEDRLAQI